MEILAELVRSGFVESRHGGVVARVDERGEVVWSLGDPATVIFPRSANKPLQALGMLRVGLPLDGRLLALAAASHSAESFHLEAVREVLALAGLEESALRTPASYPLDPAVHAELLRAGGTRSPIRMDCSGKHAAMLLTCVVNDWPTASYLDPDHPLQRAIMETFIDLTGAPPDVVGVDGCGAPLLATSVGRLARAVGTLLQGEPGSMERRLVEAMTAHPAYVSGTNRTELRLMQAFPGLVAKTGAEAVYVVGAPDGTAIALKIADGSERAVHVVMARVLELAGLAHPVLAERPAVLGAGRPVGELRPVF